MSMMINALQPHEEIDILAGALNSWCAERRIRMKSQEGLSAANQAIDLYLAGHRTQDRLLAALRERHLH
jgi:hypothetical protein